MDTYKSEMVQTKSGAGHNNWIDYMRQCAVEYKEAKSKEKDSHVEPRRRLIRKTPDPMTTQDHNKVEKTVKETGKNHTAKVKAAAKK